MEREHNLHHTFWSKREYNKRPLPSRIRNHPAMIHRIPIVDHRELHANINQPRVISPELARIALEHLERHQTAPQIERFYSLSDTFEFISRRVGKLAMEAGYFTDHMEMQLPYLERRID
jgi:hypothetical protein